MIMHSIRLFFGLSLMLLLAQPYTQAQDREEKILFDGKVVTALITEQNDTMIIIDLEGIPISSPRSFANAAERKKYYKYRRYANKVYPYAIEAIKNYRYMEEVGEKEGKKARKKYVKARHKELKTEFKDQLKSLTKTQGYILIKMVERELGVPMFDVIKETRGGWHAFTYNIAGNVNGYSLKDGYTRGEDRILDIVLDDFMLGDL